MTQTVPATAVLGPGKTGLAIGYRVLDIARVQHSAFTTTNVAETGTAGTYSVAGGAVVPDAGGHIVWGVSGTDYAEATVDAVSAGGLTAQETADAVNNLAPAGASGATGSIRAELDAIRLVTDAIDTNTGAYSYSNTVDDGAGNLLDGVFVELATDAGMTNVVNTTYTNASGAFTVYSDTAGTHYLRLQHNGYTFSIQTVVLA